MYTCLVDAAKAFDKVNLSKLLSKLLRKCNIWSVTKLRRSMRHTKCESHINKSCFSNSIQCLFRWVVAARLQPNDMVRKTINVFSHCSRSIGGLCCSESGSEVTNKLLGRVSHCWGYCVRGLGSSSIPFCQLWLEISWNCLIGFSNARCEMIPLWDDGTVDYKWFELKVKGTLWKSGVASRLFQTYCLIFYGRNVWNMPIASIFAQPGTKPKIFNLSYNVHRYLPFIAQTRHIRDQYVERFRTLFATSTSRKIY